ncbi:hypothetical protein DFQ26_001296 [Actinomortierella ambigua]|nr:hypothetical protein DFQ26_001296 [Actinomortierella ambigua]
MKDLYQVERTCRTWYSQFIPAAKYTKIITGACRLTLLTHVWLEADSDDEEADSEDEEDSEIDSDERASKSICTELCDDGCDESDDGTDGRDFDNGEIASDAAHRAMSTHLPSPLVPGLGSAPSPRPSASRRPLCHATTAVPLICTGVHPFSRTAVFRSPKQLILPELETNRELIRFELQFSEWPLNDRVRKMLTELCCRDGDEGNYKTEIIPPSLEYQMTTDAREGTEINSTEEGHPFTFAYAPPSIPSTTSLTPLRLSIPAADNNNNNNNNNSRDFNNRQMDEVVKYFSKTRIHKCSRRPIGQSWRAGDAGQSLSSYEVVIVGGPPAEQGPHSGSDHDSDESDDDNDSDNDNDESSRRDGVIEAGGREQPTQRRRARHVFPGALLSAQRPIDEISHQPPLSHSDVSCGYGQPSIPPAPKEPHHYTLGSRKDTRVCCPDDQEPQALLVYASEDIPQEGYDPETHVPHVDPQTDKLTYDADLTWRDAQKASEIWVYITASFLASGYQGSKTSRLSEKSESPPCGEAPVRFDQQPICRFHQDNLDPPCQQRQQEKQQQQQQNSLHPEQGARLTTTSSLHPALQGLRQRYDKCLQKSMDCQSCPQPRAPSSSPPPSTHRSQPPPPPLATTQQPVNIFPYSPPPPQSTTSSSNNPWANPESSVKVALSLPTATQPRLLPTMPMASQQQQTFCRVGVIQEFRERISLLQSIVEEQQLPWYPHYLNDKRVVRWLASRDTWLTRDDAITDRENAISLIRRLVKQKQDQPLVHHQAVSRLFI